MRPLLLALCPLLPLAAQSPMFRGNPAHTGVYPAAHTAPTGQVAWQHTGMTDARYMGLPRAEGAPMHPTTPAVEGDRIAYSVGPFVFLLDREGREQRCLTLDRSVLGSVALTQDTLYAATEDGALHAFDLKDGRRRWRTALGAPTALQMLDHWDVLHSSPTLEGGRVYLGTADGSVGAIDGHTGKVLWKRNLGQPVRSSPAVAEGRVFVGDLGGKLHALDARTGKALWSADTRETGVPWRAIQGSCAVEGDRVLVGSRSTFLYAYDAATGRQLWKQARKNSWIPASPAVRSGIAYVGQSDGDQIQAVDARGQVRWTTKTAGATFASPALAGDRLYVATNHNYDMGAKGTLSALDPDSGKVHWTLSLPASVWASPVPIGDRVLVTCADGKLYAVK